MSLLELLYLGIYVAANTADVVHRYTDRVYSLALLRTICGERGECLTPLDTRSLFDQCIVLKIP